MRALNVGGGELTCNVFYMLGIEVIIFFSASGSDNWMNFGLYHGGNRISSISLTSEDCKEAEHDGVEESQAHGQGVFMDDSRDDEHGEHSSCSEFPFRQLQGSERERRSLAQSSRVRLVQCGFCTHTKPM